MKARQVFQYLKLDILGKKLYFSRVFYINLPVREFLCPLVFLRSWRAASDVMARSSMLSAKASCISSLRPRTLAA
jgi:hypothetical protein